MFSYGEIIILFVIFFFKLIIIEELKLLLLKYKIFNNLEKFYLKKLIKKSRI